MTDAAVEVWSVGHSDRSWPGAITCTMRWSPARPGSTSVPDDTRVVSGQPVYVDPHRLPGL